MNIDFEIFGQITDAETFARGPSIRELSQLRARFGTDAGESVKGLPMCVSVMLRYGLPKFIGNEAHGIGKVRMKIKRYLD